MKEIYYSAKNLPLPLIIKRVTITLVIIPIIINLAINGTPAKGADIEVHTDNPTGTISQQNVIIATGSSETFKNLGTLTSNTSGSANPPPSHWGMMAHDGGTILNGGANYNGDPKPNANNITCNSCLILGRGYAVIQKPNINYGTNVASVNSFYKSSFFSPGKPITFSLSGLHATIIGKVGAIDTDFKASMLGSGQDTHLINYGDIGDRTKINDYEFVALIGTTFINYGMVAINGAKAFNYGGIYLNGSYGMISIGRHIASYVTDATKNNIGGTASNIANYGTIANAGYYGMLTIGGASSNHNLIQNYNHIGMLAYGYTVTGTQSRATNYGTISNLGNYGMVALDGARAMNLGLIKTFNDMKGTDRGDYGMVAEGDGSLAQNSGGRIENAGDYGLVASYGGNAINMVHGAKIGIISNKGNYGIMALGANSIATNSSVVSNKGDYGIVASGANSLAKNSGKVLIDGTEGGYAEDGGKLINSRGASIKSAAPVLHATGQGSIIENSGEISALAGSKGTPVIAEKGTELYNYKDGGVITYAANEVGVQLDQTNFFNSGSILPDPITTQNSIAVQMYKDPKDNSNSILELASGTHIQGEVDAGLGEDILVISGNHGSVKVENGEVINFEKVVAISGSTTLYGVYKLNLSSVPTYSQHAFTNLTLDMFDNRAQGDLSIAGRLDLKVDYDNIIDSTTNSSKVLAGTISTIGNGSVNLVNGGKTTDDIITTALAHDKNLQAFDLDNIILVKGPMLVNPNFYTVSGPNGIFDPTAHRDWKSFTVGDQVVQGSITINQRFEKKPDAIVTTGSPSKAKINNDKNVVIYKKEPTAYILVPRNRVDLDKYYQLSDYVNSLTIDSGYDYHSSNNTLSLREITGFSGKFSSKANYNYDYGTSGSGLMFGLKHKHSNTWQTGFGLLYNESDVKYHGLILQNTYIGEKGNTYHKEKIRSMGSIAYADYSYKNTVISLGLEAQFSNHDQKIAFSDGKALGRYKSSLLGSNISITYNINTYKDLKIIPSFGLKYIHLDEGKISYSNDLVVSPATSNAVVGVAKLSLSDDFNFSIFDNQLPNKISWEISATLKHRLTNKTLHERRKLTGFDGYINVHELTYSPNEFNYFASVNYRINPLSTLRLQYDKEKSSNIDNNKISLEFIHNL